MAVITGSGRLSFSSDSAVNIPLAAGRAAIPRLPGLRRQSMYEASPGGDVVESTSKQLPSRQGRPVSLAPPTCDHC